MADNPKEPDEKVADQGQEPGENQDQDQDEKAEDAKLQCTVDVSDAGAWKKKISITIGRDEIDKEQDRQYGELRRTADVPGFRKGRAPRRLVEKRFGQDVNKQVKLRLMAQAFEQIDENNDFDVLGEPDFDPETIELPDTGDMTFEYEIEVKPQFELPTLEGVRVEKPILDITPEQIDSSVERLQRQFGRVEQITDGAAVEGDAVSADVTMQIDGAAEPVKETDCTVRVGAAAVMGVLVEDMGKVLDGVKVGESRTCKAEVPDTHATEEYRGKTAEFTLEVKGIRRMVPAELNEEFLAALGLSDQAELRARLEEQMESQADQEVRKQMIGQVRAYLAEKIDFELPAGVAARHAERFLLRRYYDLVNQGVPAEEIKENMDKLRAASSAQSGQELKMSFIMEKVADKLEVEVSEAEVNGHIAEMAARNNRRPERLRDEMAREGRLESLTEAIREERALDKMLEMAEVVDAPTAAPTKKSPAKAKAKIKAKDQTTAKDEVKDGEDDAPAKKSAKKKTKKPDQASGNAGPKTTRKEVKRKPPVSDSK